MKKRLLVGLSAVAMLVSSCSNNDDAIGSVEANQPASIKITISGETSTSTRAIDPAIIPEESAIRNYTVIVVNSVSNTVQAVETFGSTLTSTVSGLTSGPKTVVVVTNTNNTALTLPSVGDSYSVFDNPANNLLLAEQSYDVMLTNGLVMSGEAAVTLNPGANTLAESLKVKRVVAKVKLGTVTLAPVAGHEGDFQLKNVAIMKTKGEATYGPNNIFTFAPFLGGFLGTVSVQQSADLVNILTNSDNIGRMFYIFPNDNTDNNETLLTIEGTYNGETRYFPIRINDAVLANGSTTDGTYIQRNSVYTLNVTIKRPNDGSTDPEVPVDPATLDLTIQVEDWATFIQNVEI